MVLQKWNIMKIQKKLPSQNCFHIKEIMVVVSPPVQVYVDSLVCSK